MYRSDEQFVESLVRVGRDRYGHGGQLKSLDVLLVDGPGGGGGGGGADDSTSGDGCRGSRGCDADVTAATAQRQRELLAVGPAAVVVLGQVVRAPGLPYRPHRYAVPNVRVLVNGTDIDGRVDAGPGPQQVPDTPVQRIGQAAPHQMPLETTTNTTGPVVRLKFCAGRGREGRRIKRFFFFFQAKYTHAGARF